MLVLRTKEDIIVPFETIGEDGWAERTRALLEEYAEIFGETVPAPLSEKMLSEFEAKLGVRFPAPLRLFYATFGIANIGEELQILENIAPLSEWAEGFDWEDWADDEERSILPYLMTFSEYLGNGNAFCFHKETGEIYYFDHDTAPHLVKLLPTADDYFKGCLIALQEAFFEEGDASEIVEDKLVDVLGERVITKWMF